MLRKTFSQEIQEIKDEILLLSSMVEKAVTDSVLALTENDLDRSQQVFSDATLIKRRCYEIEMSIIVLMAT